MFIDAVSCVVEKELARRTETRTRTDSAEVRSYYQKLRLRSLGILRVYEKLWGLHKGFVRQKLGDQKHGESLQNLRQLVHLDSYVNRPTLEYNR